MGYPVNIFSATKRHPGPELLDLPNLPKEDLEQNLKELDFINRYLGGHDITIDGIEQLLLKSFGTKSAYKKPIRILDVGCGGGDTLRAIARWAYKYNIQVELHGLDLLPECIAFAESQISPLPIQYHLGDCFDEKTYPDVEMDIWINALFCHHFSDAQLALLLPMFQSKPKIGFVINDLHRHALAFHSIGVLTSIFSSSYLVKHDAAMSVSRGFLRGDWGKYFELDKVKIEWKWAFRWLVWGRAIK